MLHLYFRFAWHRIDSVRAKDNRSTRHHLLEMSLLLLHRYAERDSLAERTGCRGYGNRTGAGGSSRITGATASSVSARTA